MEYLLSMGEAFDEFDKATRDKLTENFRGGDDDSEFRRMEKRSRRRARVLDDLLDLIVPDIEELEKLADGDEEQQQIYREYDGLIECLRKYKDMMQTDLDEAEANSCLLGAYRDEDEF